MSSNTRGDGPNVAMVSGIGIGKLEVRFAEPIPLSDALKGIDVDNGTVVVEGKTVTGSAISSTMLKGGESVKVVPRAEGGC